MVQASDIRWSSYKQYEGPFYLGRMKYHLPPNPTEADRMMAVITATEGGSWNAVNMYDTCMHTVGLIQWCEKYFLVSELYGKVVQRSEVLLFGPLGAAMGASGVTRFSMNSRGRWRFFKGSDEVNTPQEMQQMFFLNSTGHKGTWDQASRAHAKMWAAGAASVFEHPDAIEVQKQYTIDKLTKGAFTLPYARGIMSAAPQTSLGYALRSAYVSYAANNPTWANKYLKEAVVTSKAEPYSIDWLIDVLRSLTFGPRVHIYPHRYKAIRPVLERLYGIDLPDLPNELKNKWEMTPTEVQQLLVDLGYDLGSFGEDHNGVDGNPGAKTREAVREFQRAHGLEEDGHVGDETIEAMKLALHEVNKVKSHEDDVIGPYLRAQISVAVAGSVRSGLDEYFKHRRPLS